MSDLYGTSQTYVNKITTLTPEQFGDKVDLFYGHLASKEPIFSVNVFTVENEELDVTVASFVPDGHEPQSYFEQIIEPLIKEAMRAASLSVAAKVAVPLEVGASV